jgi:hypothetical protein
VGIDATALLFADISFTGTADVVVGGYFWQHSYTEDTYAGGRIQIAASVAQPQHLAFASVDRNLAGELIGLERERAFALTASCP